MYDNYCRIRDSKGLKDAEIARLANIPKSSLSEWKNGRSIPKEAKLEKIANVLGVTTYELRTGLKPEVPSFDSRHLDLIDMFEKLTESQKEHILNTMKLFLDSND